MATDRIIGERICAGADPRWASLPISNLPAGALKVRRRIRYNDWARAYVKTATELQEWTLAPNGKFTDCESVRLAHLQGDNATKG